VAPVFTDPPHSWHPSAVSSPSPAHPEISGSPTPQPVPSRRSGRPRTALVLGGASDIAQVTLGRLAGLGLAQVVLAVRDPRGVAERTAVFAPELDVSVTTWDARDADAHARLVDTATAALGQIDLVLCAVGVLGHGAGLGMEPAAVDEMVRVNFAGTAAALSAAADRLVEQRHGLVVVLSSVAGVRPRRSNYVYGASKAGLDAFARGMADALHGTGVRVVVVRTGFVQTKMTSGLPPAPFATDAGAVASAIVRATTRRRGGVLWVPRLLGPLFAGARLLPASWWRRIAGDR
jgi:decaprenylphospho-beta-D-erythro-pentofuranosid-2-ulose 2-reductase